VKLRIRTGKSKPKPLAKKPRNPRIAKPKATRGQVERGNRLALASAKGGW
jgi:hypothetical protein